MNAGVYLDEWLQSEGWYCRRENGREEGREREEREREPGGKNGPFSGLIDLLPSPPYRRYGAKTKTLRSTTSRVLATHFRNNVLVRLRIERRRIAETSIARDCPRKDFRREAWERELFYSLRILYFRCRALSMFHRNDYIYVN